MLLNIILGILFCSSLAYNFIQSRKLRERYDEITKKITLENTEEIKKQKELICQLKKEEKELADSIERKLISESARFAESVKRQEELIDAKIEAYKKQKEFDIDKSLAAKITEANQSLERFLDTCATITRESEEFKEEILKELEDYRAKRAVVNEAILRERELNEKKDFYRIQISETDIHDIKKLKEIGETIQRKEIIAKIIWEVIASRPTAEMIKRITGGRNIAGIYKVTYIPTGESYIGKTTNMRNRLRNHVATAIGLEKAASSTFHTHMEKNGFWNYTWEVLEEVDRAQLGEREKYWIDFYGTKEYGLNQKSGG